MRSAQQTEGASAVNYLSKLTITQLKSPERLSPAEQRRIKLVSKLEEQLAMARAQIAGETYSVTKQTWGRDTEGNKVRVTREKKLAAWWFKDGAGLSMVVRYGAKILELAKGKRALSVPDLAALPEVIGTVIEGVKAGELDAAIDVVAGVPKLKLPGKQSSKA